MTPRLVVALGLRLLAISWVLYTLGHMYGLSRFLEVRTGDSLSPYLIWGAAILQLLICAALWIFPSTIAERILPSAARRGEDAAPPQLADWQALGVVCIGLWSLAEAIPRAAFWIDMLMLESSRDSAYLGSNEKASIAALVVQLLLSFWLVFGSRGIARFIFKLRTAGVSTQDEPG